MKNSFFEVNEALQLDVDKKFDHVISHSVFHYFENLEYAENVIKKMINKANLKIGIFDINDNAKKEIYHKIRMQKMNQAEYNEKYKGLDHLFYDKKWFDDLAKKFDLKIDIFDQVYEKYENSSLRFNVIMEK